MGAKLGTGGGPMADMNVTPLIDVGQHIVVSIHPELGWAVEQEPADEETLVELINAEYRLNPARSILIKADKSLEYQDVRKLMDILADNNQTSVLIAAAEE
jgi:biopolymer transport protein ExbD